MTIQKVGDLPKLFINQEWFDDRMQLSLDKCYEQNVPQEETGLLLLEWKGGKCTACGTEFEKVIVKSEIADYVWYRAKCECLLNIKTERDMQRNREKKIESAGVPAVLRKCRFADWDYIIQDKTNEAFKVVYDITKKEEYFKSGIILYGNVGTGKTHCAISLMWEASAKPIAMKYINMSDITSSFINKQAGVDLIDYLKRNYDLVMFDDIDKVTTQSEWVRERIFSLFNNLINEQKIILATTNFQKGSDFVDKFGQAITSRLISYCTIVEFTGDDYRKKSKDRGVV